MRREAQSPPLLETNSVWPWFIWQLCVICEHEFRRERGFQVWNQMGASAHPTCVCSICASSEKEAADIVLKHRRDNRPPPPKTSQEINTDA